MLRFVKDSEKPHWPYFVQLRKTHSSLLTFPMDWLNPEIALHLLLFTLTKLETHQTYSVARNGLR